MRCLGDLLVCQWTFASIEPVYAVGFHSTKKNLIKNLLRWCDMHFMIVDLYVGQFTGVINLDRPLLGAHVAHFLSLIIFSHLC